MIRKTIWIILSFLMALFLVLSSCTTTVEEEEEEEGPPPVEEEEEEEEGPPPVGGDWWDALGEPEYGGSITVRWTAFEPGFDPWVASPSRRYWWFEHLVCYDWTLDRETWAFTTAFVPVEYHVGILAKDWEMTDLQTLVVNIREEARWQDKPPVNGREFTAYDVEHHYHRIMGIGSGYTNASFYAQWLNLIESVTATDDKAVVFKFNTPSITALWQVFDPVTMNLIHAPESAADGSIADWKSAVGTGAWILTDFVEGSSLTCDRNPNYYLSDERHPENQLPYANKLKALIIPDIATAMAAIRTGKVDVITDLGWEQASSLLKTNPELMQKKVPGEGEAVILRVDNEPFTDIRVRKALQMALDRRTIAETHFGGRVDGTPAGMIHPYYKQFCYPYDEWPQELKDEYSYNPEQARALLAEAGYPGGFKTDIVASTNADLDLLQIIKAQFMDIGVDMDIQVMEETAITAYTRGRKHQQMGLSIGGGCARTVNPQNVINQRLTGDANLNRGNVSDPAYDASVQRFFEATSNEAAFQALRDADKLSVENHWTVNTFPTVAYTVWQPYLKGYSGEAIGWAQWHLWSRLWVDQELKQSL